MLKTSTKVKATFGPYAGGIGWVEWSDNEVCDVRMKADDMVQSFHISEVEVIDGDDNSGNLAEAGAVSD